MGCKASNYNVAAYFYNSKDSNVSSESANQPGHEYHADIYSLCHHKGPICFVIIECQVMAMSNKRALGQIAPPFKISFLIGSVRILLKIIHLASSSHIWSLLAENHTLTKSKSRSIAQGRHIWSLFYPIHIKSWPKIKSGQVGVDHCRSLVRSLLKITHLTSRKAYLSGHDLPQLIWKVDQNKK